MSSLPDRVGQSFGKLTVIALGPRNKYGGATWFCRCSCGNEVTVTNCNLITGNSKSCGKCSIVNHTYTFDEDVVVCAVYDKKFTISAQDYPLVSKYRWNMKDRYPATYVNGEKVRLHTILMGETDGLVVDHINRDKSDNRRCNLRLVTKSINLVNTAQKPTRGVSFDSRSNRWHARIQVNGKTKHLGYYADINDALRARTQAEILYYGEYCPREEATNE